MTSEASSKIWRIGEHTVEFEPPDICVVRFGEKVTAEEGRAVVAEELRLTEEHGVGDNLEVDGLVLHIETVTHSASIDDRGNRNFNTALTLSEYQAARLAGESRPERVLEEWHGLVARAERLESRLPEEYRDAFFQLVLYPVKASAVVHELYISVGRNRLHALQGSVVANEDASRARELFELDGALAEQYHSLGGGKWNHMMSQINLGYTYWQQPEIETMKRSFCTTLPSEAGWPSNFRNSR